MKRYHVAFLCGAASWGLFLSRRVFEVIGFLGPMAAFGLALAGLFVAAGALSRGKKPRCAAVLSGLLNLTYMLFFAVLVLRAVK